MLYNLNIIRSQKSRDFYIPLSILEELYFFYNSMNNYKTVLIDATKEVLYKLKAQVASYNLDKY
jgi:hypothetical protein